MQSKSLLIAIAAFAVTATGAQAFVGSNYIIQAGLSTTQVEAFTQARELRRKGEVEKARDVLLEAGVDEKTMVSLRKAAHASHEALHTAVANNDFAAFKVAAEGSPLSDIITTEEDFALFKQAHDLRMDGKFVEAKEIFDELGLPNHKMGKGHGPKERIELTDTQRDALRVAKQGNDLATVKAILKEAGVSDEQIARKIEKGGRHSWH